MKKVTSLIGFLTLLLLLPAPVEAQLLRKLKEKAKESAERTILNRTGKEVSKGTDKAIDGILKEGKNKDGSEVRDADINEEQAGALGDKLKDLLGGLGEMGDGTSSGGSAGKLGPEMIEKALAEAEPAPEDQNIQLPEAYTFSYQLTTEVSNSLGKQEANYLLEPGKSYYAEESTDSGGLKHVIYDDENLTLLHFLESNGSMEFWREKMSVFTAARMVGAYKDGDNRGIKTLHKKNVLGFDAQGYEINTDDGVMEIWVTHDAPATLFGTMFSERSKVKGSPFQSNDMILEMKYSSAKSADKNYHWLCTALVPKSKTFNITSLDK